MKARVVLAALAVVALSAGCSSDGEASDSESVEWTGSGVCGDVFFWAASTDGTRAVSVIAADNRSQDQPSAMTFSLPDAPVTVEVVEGEGLDGYFCTDLPKSGSEVLSTARAATATGEITLDAPDRPCYEVTGRLSMTGLTTDDGTSLPDVSIDARGVGCVSG